MKKYESYKDSGVEWIGEIPSHWEVRKLKFVMNYQKGKNPDKFSDIKTNYVYLSMDYLRNDNSKILYIENINELVFVNKNEILLLWDGSNAGEFIKSKRGYLSSTMALIKVFNIFNKEYIWYFCKFIERELRNKTIGMGIPHINSKELKNIIIVVPPLPEQKKISSFLDEKVEKIEKAISKKEKLIKLLKEQKQVIINEAVTKGIDKNVEYKDSGVEWIGKIPKHWEVRKLKNYCRVFGRIGFRGYNTSDLVGENKGAITISPSNIKDYYMDFSKCSFLSWQKYEESPEIQIQEEDIVIVKTGSSYGKIGQIKNLPTKATINPQLLVFKNLKINKRFFYYIMKSKIILLQIEQNIIGSTIPTISETKILNFKFLLPPLLEQQKIVSYIEEKISKIDNLIQLQQKQIEKLKEYKITLIDEVVTGKIKVFDE